MIGIAQEDKDMTETTIDWDKPPFCVAGYEGDNEEYSRAQDRDDFGQLVTIAEEEERKLTRTLRSLPRNVPKARDQREKLAVAYEQAADQHNQLSMTVHRMGESIQRIRDETRRCEGNAELIREDKGRLFGAVAHEIYGSALASEEIIVQRAAATQSTLEGVMAKARDTLWSAKEKMDGWHTAPDAHFDDTQTAGAPWPNRDAVTELIDVGATTG